MFPSILLYTGIALASVGALSIVYPLRFLRIRTRAAGAGFFLAGLVTGALALALPIRERRATSAASRIDEFMPVWQFDERHAISVDAPPERVFDAIHAVTANEVFLFRTLTAIRRLGRPLPESILNVPKQKSLIDVATSTTFLVLADDAPRELVVGTVIAAPPEVRASGRLRADLFQKKLRPGVTLATMNFQVEPDGRGGSVVSTETRIFGSSRSAIRRFGVYWRFIHPGSDIIRRSWLQAIKRRAEQK